MTKTIRHVAILIFTTAIIAALLAWSFRKVENPEKVWEAFRTARWGALPFAFLAGMLVFPLKAWRWGMILASEKRIRFMRLLSPIMIGFMANCFGFRIGEIVRAAALAVEGEIKTARGLASIALERIFDMCTVMLFLVIALLWITPSGSEEAEQKLDRIRATGSVMAVLFIIGIVFLVLLKLWPKAMTRFTMTCSSWLPERLRGKVQAFLGSFLSGLNALHSVRQVFVLFLVSIVHWAAQVLYFLFIGYCFPELGLSLAGAMLVFALVALSVSAGALPLYMGVFQAAVSFAVVILGLPSEIGVSYAWLAWAMNIPPIIIIGFIFLWLEGLTLGELKSGASRKA